MVLGVTSLDQEHIFLDLVLRNQTVRTVLDRAPALGLPDWWLTAGALFQTVWNVQDGRHPEAGIRDYDLFYFDASDLSWEAEDTVIQRAERLFADLDRGVEVRNEARVHLWYEERFGVPAAPFTSSRDAIDHFAAITCCFGLTSSALSGISVYAPHGYDDLLGQQLRPNPVLAPREVYELKATRWKQEWPGLSVQPWPIRSERIAPRSVAGSACRCKS